MQLQAIKKLSFLQWCWLIEAYWRLWPVQLKIKFGRPAWLVDKLVFSQPPTELAAGLQSVSLQPSMAELPRHLHESVRLAARCHFWAAACLPRSIVLADMLNRRGLQAAVRIGVMKSDGTENSLASHAWVEVQGCIIGEPETIAAQFTPIKGKTTR